MNEEETLLVCSTFPEIETARRIARQLVTENFAACANIIPAVESIYRWQDKIEDAPETLVLFKATAARYLAFQEKLRALHPYEVPEIICLPISGGLPEYLQWVRDGAGAPSRREPTA
jgi:periplasmic divalent cation tolerance protein